MRKEFSTTQAPEPSPHLYNDRSLGPLEFLLQVMHATHLPMVTRVQAAAAILPFTNSVPKPQAIPPRCIIRIGGFGTDPCPTNEESQSKSEIAHINLTRDDEAQAPENLTRYSDPLTPEEIQQISAAVHRLRPDLHPDPTKVPEFHLCPCGHWITGEYDCCRRERSKLN